ncbi:hypothetical protein GPECTOR_38g255 [Gonium pectorale]|uniref:ABC transporter domain-containing protein n=1 Tax=Gonium pectorale TaxID=33097 RepID=A0A150GB29_GONPE|nr:hypothetical protein GPECTOR_38g255 [Gonium pectorale]|eukprot:KXZ47018.1 hypothetical protein GPECTOR_38g255 [Gonium pectorale]
MFNFLGRDFFTALSEKDEAQFQIQLIKYLAGFALGIPVFVFKSYYQSKLALEWRQWMTERLLSDYLAGRAFYQLQQSGEVDNPDQRIASDVATFTDTATSLSLTLLNAAIDLVSFSGILFAIYPPLFAALLAYSLGGTAASVYLGKGKDEATARACVYAPPAPQPSGPVRGPAEAGLPSYGLVRVRENAESIAFYGGDAEERELLKQRLQAAVANYLGLLTASRNLDFFTSFYRYLIQLLPAAVVAPLFFQGKIDFGVINQSQSAFNHILNDVSLVIYQIEALAGFSAVVDRLGEFTEAIGARKEAAERLAAAGAAADAVRALPATATAAEAPGAAAATASAVVGGDGASDADAAAEAEAAALPGIQLRFLSEEAQQEASASGAPALRVEGLTVMTPRGGAALMRNLDLEVPSGSSLLVMGPSGAGKTSLLRAVAGLWSEGAGRIEVGATRGSVMFLPQRPYMVLGSLRDQALYPRRHSQDDASSGSGSGEAAPEAAPASASSSAASLSEQATQQQPAYELPSDEEVAAVLQRVQLGHLLRRYGSSGGAAPSHSGNGNGSGAPPSASPAPSAPSASPASSPSCALDAVVDWSSVLSLGEQQRLGWARLLLARPTPRLALLDEATSGLDADTEAALYKVLRDSGITYVSVGHRASLRDYHSALLQLRPDGEGGVVAEVRQLERAAAAVQA